MKRNMFVILLILALAVVFILLALAEDKDKSEENNKLLNIKEKQIEESRNYSRVNLFVGSSERISLAIPENWEGKYRLEEKGNSAVFYYIGDPESKAMLFTIKKYNKNNLENTKKESIIANKNGTVFTSILSTGSNVNSTEIKTMSKDVAEIINSLK